MDQFFTPPEIATKLVQLVSVKRVISVADFAAGDGELLRAAQKRWPNAVMIATDIDQHKVQYLRRTWKEWKVGWCDFLSDEQRGICRVLAERKGAISIVLINPPFSCRGNDRVSAELGGKSFRCSKAIGFVMTAASYLSANGAMVAVLPAGCFCSAKDEMAWKAIRERFRVRVAATHGEGTFEDCSARTKIVVLSPRKRKLSSRPLQKGKRKWKVIKVELVRGAVPVHSALNGLAGRKWPFLHTTELRDGETLMPTRHLKLENRSVTGPAVLMPRVGEPDPKKCVVYSSEVRIVLSDCVFAIVCSSTAAAKRVQVRLLSEWRLVHSFYGGTCAPYITIVRMVELLGRLGVIVTRTVPALRKPTQ